MLHQSFADCRLDGIEWPSAVQMTCEAYGNWHTDCRWSRSDDVNAVRADHGTVRGTAGTIRCCHLRTAAGPSDLNHASSGTTDMTSCPVDNTLSHEDRAAHHLPHDRSRRSRNCPSDKGHPKVLHFRFLRDEMILCDLHQGDIGSRSSTSRLDHGPVNCCDTDRKSEKRRLGLFFQDRPWGLPR